MWLLKHPLHGHKNAYHPAEVAADQANGWEIEQAPTPWVEPADEAAPAQADEPADERAALRAELRAKGVDFDRRWSAKRLREALAGA